MFPTDPGGVASAAASLTDPGDEVAAVVDLAVIGCRGDGKTQFILNAIRTLDAYAAPGLADVERENSQRIHRIALDARAPSLDATAPGARPHYIYRVEPGALFGQLETWERVALLARTARLWLHVALALGNAVLVGAALWLLGKSPQLAVGAGVGLAVVMTIVSVALSIRRFRAAGEIEVVFWDVAGEDALRGGDYHELLRTIVERRREEDRPYGFAPVLVCNPLSLERHEDGGSYVRLKKVLPLYASLDRADRRALVVITRANLVEEICADGSDEDERVAVRSLARRNAQGRADAGATPVRHGEAVLVRRGAVQRYCRDAEDGVENGIAMTYLRYDAGDDCTLESKPGEDGTPVLEYTYTDDVAAFESEMRGKFLSWLAQVAYRAPRKARATVAGRATTEEPAPEEDVIPLTVPARTTATRTTATRPAVEPAPAPSSAGSGGFSSGGS